MWYIIGAVAALVLLFLGYSYWMRKQIYREVDRLGRRKSELMHRPVAEEIGKVKGLTISGETEEKFERWRREWDRLVEEELPSVEDDLFEIDELVNRYRFNKAKAGIQEADEKLDRAEQTIDEIVKDVQELIESEEKNRVDIDEAAASYEEAVKVLHEHRRSLGRAASILERQLRGLKNDFITYDEETEAGNYIQAREIVIRLQEQLKLVRWQMEEIPKLLVETEVDLPREINELVRGIEEMKSAGYPLKEEELDNKIQNVRNELHEIGRLLEQLHVEEAAYKLTEVKTSVDEMYTELEEEAEARAFVEQQISSVQEAFENVQHSVADLKAEKEKVEQSYRIPEEELERQNSSEHAYTEVAKQWRVFEDQYEHQKRVFSGLKTELEQVQKRLNDIEADIYHSREVLHSLRKDEIEAVASLKEQRRKLKLAQQKLQKHTLPKVPGVLINEMNEAGEQLDKAARYLEEVPLEMGKVNAAIREAESQVERMENHLAITASQARRAELLIQQCNQFRTQSQTVNETLNEAEAMFREGRYDEAVQKVRPLLERRRPQAVEYVEEEVKQLT
ncbi:septation ring formation regulator [Salsuginibacillus halophilus]|uniref:Septation ring formation regulator n=1 Tax=Salsuginibacillus halophilus TaxID=517424 RepID=A0A2P8HBM6_9BACI|nr:septation ring formation regulator EzrA [Salsuginibacillus halophilus]PSL43623.1 septation ring formation regulator [Salsuginibacillus halophilus]